MKKINIFSEVNPLFFFITNNTDATDVEQQLSRNFNFNLNFKKGCKKVKTKECITRATKSSPPVLYRANAFVISKVKMCLYFTISPFLKVFF